MLGRRMPQNVRVFLGQRRMSKEKDHNKKILEIMHKISKVNTHLKAINTSYLNLHHIGKKNKLLHCTIITTTAAVATQILT